MELRKSGTQETIGHKKRDVDLVIDHGSRIYWVAPFSSHFRRIALNLPDFLISTLNHSIVVFD
jgi:hypothetical protein